MCQKYCDNFGRILGKIEVLIKMSCLIKLFQNFTDHSSLKNPEPFSFPFLKPNFGDNHTPSLAS